MCIRDSFYIGPFLVYLDVVNDTDELLLPSIVTDQKNIPLSFQLFENYEEERLPIIIDKLVNTYRRGLMSRKALTKILLNLNFIRNTIGVITLPYDIGRRAITTVFGL
eukprot:TRINITY_DN13072_c0_g1_i1.p1 TRINITY_DN13072_c0_g1~~TRINITY_DN13072_c0_g1_i1.p1  ORF type:complete len:108 (-),score=14.64 TRINITY_DN13072_c0_g1_i1:42-365(-)